MCSRCGYQNQPGYAFCTNCGAPLAAAGVPAAAGSGPAYPPGVAYPPAAVYMPSPTDYERAKRIDRTKTGILLILVGTLLSWVPLLINVIGYLLIFFGLVLLVLGRKAFSRAHARNVVLTIVLLFLGIGALIGSAFPLGFTIGFAQVSGTVPTADELASEFQFLLIGQIVGAAMFGLMSVLFTYALQKQPGRLLLFGGFGAAVALSLAIYIIVAPQVPATAQNAIASGTFDSRIVLALENLTTSYGLLNAVPSALFGAAEYLAWSRINRGEIPAPPLGPESPFAPPPVAGMPPQAPPSGPAPPLNPR